MSFLWYSGGRINNGLGGGGFGYTISTVTMEANAGGEREPDYLTGAIVILAKTFSGTHPPATASRLFILETIFAAERDNPSASSTNWRISSRLASLATLANFPMSVESASCKNSTNASLLMNDGAMLLLFVGYIS